MDKQKFTEEIEKLNRLHGDFKDYVAFNEVLYLIRQLDEPQKVVIPQYVADWIEYCKNTFLSITRALMVNEVDFYNYANQEDHSKLIIFLESEINQEKFSKAWLFGYEAEKEKKYLVKIKGDVQENILVYGYGVKRYFFSSYMYGNRRTYHTKDELTEAGFEWVFSSEGVEVKEEE